MVLVAMLAARQVGEDRCLVEIGALLDQFAAVVAHDVAAGDKHDLAVEPLIFDQRLDIDDVARFAHAPDIVAQSPDHRPEVIDDGPRVVLADDRRASAKDELMVVRQHVDEPVDVLAVDGRKTFEHPSVFHRLSSHQARTPPSTAMSAPVT
ncbi:MAG: hypothetical protein IPF76_13065 [Sphingopyxis sp.]|nr:hypothetical protein [Sphingopyxis sp.]MBK6413905.1 hypothetical protein [Sphingopyxis sp.]